MSSCEEASRDPVSAHSPPFVQPILQDPGWQLILLVLVSIEPTGW